MTPQCRAAEVHMCRGTCDPRVALTESCQKSEKDMCVWLRSTKEKCLLLLVLILVSSKVIFFPKQLYHMKFDRRKQIGCKLDLRLLPLCGDGVIVIMTIVKGLG